MRRTIATLLMLTLPFSNAAVPADMVSSAAATAPVTSTVVEYYNSSLDHYFITASDTEKAALDNGSQRGWARTGVEFEAYATDVTGVNANQVCRYYGRPDAGLDSHFYSASPDECGSVARKFATAWQLESSNVFRIPLPDPSNGACPAGTLPVYRLFNNRRDANHRYTTSTAVRDTMVANGYTAEGYGPNSVVFCSPPRSGSTTPTPTPGALSAIITVVPASTAAFTFVATATPSTGATLASGTWDHGDGTTATGLTSTHTYTASGTYAVRFTVTDSRGQVGIATQSVIATVAGTTPPPSTTPAAPTVTITATQMSSDTFSFSTTAIAAAGLAIAAYTWDFGDGQTSTASAETHTYASGGHLHRRVSR